MNDSAPQQTSTPADKEKPHRGIRSFVLRTGRITEAQQEAIDTLWPRYVLPHDQGQLDIAHLFGRDAPLTVEIGFGMGDSLFQMAQAAPERNFIGIEVHTPGVGRLLNRVDAAGLVNLRVFAHDAIEVLDRCLADHSIDTLQLFFPDPWPKKRHHKRRIVQNAFARQVRRKLKNGGNFHMATDWQPYAEYMLEVMEAAEGYHNAAGKGQYHPRPEHRPPTKFEQRGERLGHGVWDLFYTAE